MKYVWITKYALTKGIFKREVIQIEGNTVYVVDEKAMNRRDLYFKNDWHLTGEDAIIVAEEKRIKKLANLNKQIKKISAINFEKGDRFV